MATSGSAKKLILDSIKDVTNILVTVSKNPSVDELSAAMGLTIFLNKLGKHATAVASGTMPDAISFLEPNKTFEESADSLRDFIIALDKEKADHLRYKLEGEVVKIFITPYRTTISSDDLEFSQGDYNVEMVIGLNVVNEKDLDEALASHGRILHDATVATITSGSTTSSLGTIDWHDKNASSTSEMVADLLESLKTAKVVLDEQISTALLTGIVAATERFSNELTSSRVMTVAAGLMASGANQQLIVTRLEEAEPAPEETTNEKPDGSVVLEADTSTKVAKQETAPQPEPAEPVKAPADEAGMIRIEHEPRDLDTVARQVAEESQEAAAREATEQFDELTERVAPVETEPAMAPYIPTPLAQPSNDPLSALQIPSAPAPMDITEELRREVEGSGAPAQAVGSLDDRAAPLIGGTLNATADQAAADKRREAERDQNRTILTHGKPIGDDEPAIDRPPINAAMGPSDEEPPVDIFATAPSLPTVVASPLVPSSQQGELLDAALTAAVPTTDISSIPTIEPLPPVRTEPTLADLDSQARGSMPTAPPTLPSMPPLPDFNDLPPLPSAPMDGTVVPSGVPVIPASEFNPSQFHIPEQHQ